MNKHTDNSIKYPHLHKSTLLANLPKDLANQFLNQSLVHSFSKTQAFIEQGQVSKGLFLVAHGHVEVSMISHSGQSTYIGQATTGGCLGEIEAINKKECIASCFARKDTVLLFTPTHQLMGFLSNIEFLKNLFLIFHDRMQYNNLFRSIDKLDPVDVRLRAYLHFMSMAQPTVRKSQTELADVIVCARQNLNKELGKLRDAGFVEIKSGAVVVLDRHRLVEGIDAA